MNVCELAKQSCICSHVCLVLCSASYGAAVAVLGTGNFDRSVTLSYNYFAGNNASVDGGIAWLVSSCMLCEPGRLAGLLCKCA